MFVYIMENDSMPGLLKIGKANDPESRARELSSTGVPLPWRVIDTVRADYFAEAVEKRAHAVLADCRVNRNREFFKTTHQEALQAISVGMGEICPDLLKGETLEQARETEREKEEARRKAWKAKDDAYQKRKAQVKAAQDDHKRQVKIKCHLLGLSYVKDMYSLPIYMPPITRIKMGIHRLAGCLGKDVLTYMPLQYVQWFIANHADFSEEDWSRVYWEVRPIKDRDYWLTCGAPHMTYPPGHERHSAEHFDHNDVIEKTKPIALHN